MTDAITREEKLLAGLAIEPITREEMFLAKLAGQDVQTPEPITRKEILLSKAIENGGTGGGSKDNEIALIARTITEYENNEITEVGAYAFANCYELISVNLPNLKQIYDYTFINCYKLTSADFPLVTKIGAEAFKNCRAATKINLPKIVTAGVNLFNGCKQVVIHDLPCVTQIQGGAFIENLSLRAVVLRNETVVTLANVSAFSICPHYQGTVDATYNPEGLFDGYVYVPRALIESYKTATNWTSLYAKHANLFRAVEDYTIDGTTNGDLDESKMIQGVRI